MSCCMYSTTPPPCTGFTRSGLTDFHAAEWPPHSKFQSHFYWNICVQTGDEPVEMKRSQRELVYQKTAAGVPHLTTLKHYSLSIHEKQNQLRPFQRRYHQGEKKSIQFIKYLPLFSSCLYVTVVWQVSANKQTVSHENERKGGRVLDECRRLQMLPKWVSLKWSPNPSTYPYTFVPRQEPPAKCSVIADDTFLLTVTL